MIDHYIDQNLKKDLGLIDFQESESNINKNGYNNAEQLNSEDENMYKAMYKTAKKHKRYKLLDSQKDFLKKIQILYLENGVNEIQLYERHKVGSLLKLLMHEFCEYLNSEGEVDLQPF